MNPKIKKKNLLLRRVTSKNIAGITLAPFGIYFREDLYENQNAVLLNHERIHWRQQLELLIVFFHLLYVTEWLIRLITHPKKNAYFAISFEREAYANQGRAGYLEKRKPYAWVKYLFK